VPDALVADFIVSACDACGGVLMPDVVFFGGSVPRATLDAAWALFSRAELLLVVGSSLAVFSGYRFVRRAAEHAIPIAIINHGETRGDAHATLRIDARAGEMLSDLAARLV
jgi:NAD-dependent SIR2 family protein deacetylase